MLCETLWQWFYTYAPDALHLWNFLATEACHCIVRTDTLATQTPAEVITFKSVRSRESSDSSEVSIFSTIQSKDCMLCDTETS